MKLQSSTGTDTKRHWLALLIAGAMLGASPAQAGSAGAAHTVDSSSAEIARWTPLIKEASRRFGIAEDWIKAVIHMETGGRTTAADGAPITSRVGAMGLMQLMPETWRDMQKQYGLGADPYDPHDNVMAGAAYLKWLYGKFGFPRMFAAYNAGPGTLGEQMAGLRQLPQETKGYVSGIARLLGSKNEKPETGDTASVQPVALRGTSTPTAEFTRPDGSKISIDAGSVVSIRSPLANEFAPGVQTVLAMGSRFQGVVEKPEQVASLLRAHGARV